MIPKMALEPSDVMQNAQLQLCRREVDEVFDGSQNEQQLRAAVRHMIAQERSWRATLQAELDATRALLNHNLIAQLTQSNLEREQLKARLTAVETQMQAVTAFLRLQGFVLPQ
jgi:hypothetical protein